MGRAQNSNLGVATKMMIKCETSMAAVGEVTELTVCRSCSKTQNLRAQTTKKNSLGRESAQTKSADSKGQTSRRKKLSKIRKRLGNSCKTSTSISFSTRHTLAPNNATPNR